MSDDLYNFLIFLLRIYGRCGFLLLLFGFARNFRLFASRAVWEETKWKFTICGGVLLMGTLLSFFDYFSELRNVFLLTGFLNSTVIYYFAYLSNAHASLLKRPENAPAVRIAVAGLEEALMEMRRLQTLKK